MSNGCRGVFKVGSDDYRDDHHDSHDRAQAAAAIAGLALVAAGAYAVHEQHEKDQRERHYDDYYDYEPNDHDLHYYQNRGQRNLIVTCESVNDRYNYCRAPIHHSHVRLLRRHSNSGCEFHRDWGYDRRGIWVEHGCRATFEIE